MQTWVAPFLDALRKLGVTAQACRAVGIGYGAVSALRHKDADFAAAFDEAMDEAVDSAEAEAWRRGVQGFDEPVVYQGQLTPVYQRDADGRVVEEVYELTNTDGKTTKHFRPLQQLDAEGRPVFLTVRKHSDALLALILKGRRKKVFADRTELTGADGGPVAMDSSARAARIMQLMNAAAQRKAQQDFGDLA